MPTKFQQIKHTLRVIRLTKKMNKLAENYNLLNKEYTDIVLPKEQKKIEDVDVSKEPLPPTPAQRKAAKKASESQQDPIINIRSIKPSTIVKHLNDYVISQDAAKKALAITVCNHLHTISSKSKLEIDKNNILLMGSSGCGKTYLVKTLAKVLDLPFVTIDATEFSPTGYKGKDVNNILDIILDKCNGSIYWAERTIVFVDELDKVVSAGTGDRGFDNGVQNALLKMIEGQEYTTPAGVLSTSKMLFIFGGAFEYLYKARDQKAVSIGFTKDNSNEEVSTLVVQQELIRFGLIKELVGRLGQVVELQDLDSEALKQILMKPKDSIIDQYNHLFKSQNIKDYVNTTDIDQIIDKATTLKCGARALKTIAAEHFRERFYR